MSYYYEEQPPNRFQKFMFTFAVLVVLVVALTGCATPLTEFERADRIAHDNDVWLVCVANYKHLGLPMKSVRYTASRIRPSEAQRLLNMRDDIRTNNCRAIYKAALRD